MPSGAELGSSSDFSDTADAGRISDADTGAPALPPTERRLDASRELDQLDPAAVLRLIHEQDRVAMDAVGAVLPQLAELVELAAARVRAGGGVHYFGAGTSGRLAMLDAAELAPTYLLEPGVVTAHLAGGAEAMLRAVEGSEDSEAAGAEAAAALGAGDLAIGLAASGGTPYVGGALAWARRVGALTVLISNNPAAPLAALAERHLVLDTGAEVVTGSTRMKAGTAQKLVLNAFSTALMVALGRTWSNLMVSVAPSNAKLRARSLRILAEATGLGPDESERALAEADGELRTAIVMRLAGVSRDTARAALAEADGSVRAAVDACVSAGR